MKCQLLHAGLAVAMLCACATTTGGAQPTQSNVLELTLARADGRTIQLNAYTGKPLLLFVFATYDEASQLALVALTQFLEQHPSPQVAGLLLQPEAETFLPLFKRSFSLPFALYYDPTGRVLQGETALGELRGVPAFVALDKTGHILEVRYGVPTAQQLSALTGL